MQIGYAVKYAVYYTGSRLDWMLCTAAKTHIKNAFKNALKNALKKLKKCSQICNSNLRRAALRRASRGTDMRRILLHI
jgi:hypothetical protein